MKIVHVIPGLTHERGGPSVVVEALTRHQAQAGHRVVLVTTEQGMRGGEHPVAVAAGVELRRLPTLGPDRLAYAPAMSGEMRRQLGDADIVHVHSIFTHPVHVAVREASRRGVPLVLRPCGLLHRFSLQHSRLQKSLYLKCWGKRVRRACSSWHYTSQNESDESWPWDDSPRFVLPNGIETADFDLDAEQAKQRVRERWPEIGDAPFVLFLGRLHPKKRVDLLVEAFLQGVPPPWRLVVAGPDEVGQWRDIQARFLGQAPASGRVTRIGLVTGADKIALLSSASLFTLPSEHENFGVAALEALAAGTPALLSPGVDLADQAAAAAVGWVEPLDTARWSHRLAELVSNRERLHDVAPRARAWVREHFDWRPLSATLVRYYEKVCADFVSKVT